MQLKHVETKQALVCTCSSDEAHYIGLAQHMIHCRVLQNRGTRSLKAQRGMLNIIPKTSDTSIYTLPALRNRSS